MKHPEFATHAVASPRETVPFEAASQRFVSAIAELAGRSREAIAGTIRRAGVSWTRPPASCSTLNADGTPVQLCLTVSPKGEQFRLLADPATDEADLAARFRSGVRAVGDAVEFLPPGARARFLGAFEEACPGPADLRSLSSGAVWVGRGLDVAWAGAYVTSRWGTRDERWERAISWLRGTVGSGVEPVASHLRSRAEPVSLSLESGADGRVRAKLYLRLLGPCALREVGVPGLNTEAIAEFLAQTLGDRAVPRTGIVISVSGLCDSNELTDAKIDVCGHCVPRSRDAWVRWLAGIGARLGMAAPRARAALSSPEFEVAFVGLGVNRRDEPRLNLYLKPVGMASRSPAAKDLV